MYSIDGFIFDLPFRPLRDMYTVASVSMSVVFETRCLPKRFLSKSLSGVLSNRSAERDRRAAPDIQVPVEKVLELTKLFGTLGASPKQVSEAQMTIATTSLMNEVAGRGF